MEFKPAFIYPLLLVAILFGTHYFDTMAMFILLILAVVPFLHKPMFIAPVYFMSSLSGSFFAAPNDLGGISRYLSVFLIISLVYSIVKQKPLSKKMNLPNGLVFILIFFSFFSCVFSLTSSLAPFFLMLQNILIVFLFSKYRNKNYKELFALVYYSAWVVLLLLLLEVSLLGFNISSLDGRFSVNEEVNFNRLAMMLAQLGVILLIPMFYKTNKINMILSIATLPIILVLIVSTGSRTALIAYLFSLILVYIFLYSKFSLQKIIIIVSFSFAIIFLWNFLQDNVSFMNRFTVKSVVDSGGTNRMGSINLLVNHVIPENVFFGVGLGGENTILSLQAFGNNLKPAHNFVVDLFTQVGLVGFVLYFIFFIIIIRQMIAYRKVNNVIYMPLLLVLTSFINGVGETVFMEKFFWNGLALGCFFLLNIKNEPKEI